MGKWIKPNKRTIKTKKAGACGLIGAGDVHMVIRFLPFAAGLALEWRDRDLRIRSRGRCVNGMDLRNAKTKELVRISFLRATREIVQFEVRETAYEYDIKNHRVSVVE